ncbi:hypothetical protein [Streptomyces enissocaesilis]|uniref:hypothetical protein n=1 Tax=Streptomyces enissocaesilis TaxID=332589 RepID=UPI0031D68EBD
MSCTRAHLESLPGLYDGLLPYLTPAGGAREGRAAKGGPPGLPVVEEILDLRGPGGIVGVVEGWTSVIRTDRRMAPRPAAGLGVEGRLRAGVAELLGHMPWIAVSWPDAGPFATDIKQLADSVRSITDPRAPGEVGRRLGKCPAIDTSGVICGAVLRYYPGAATVTCPWCQCAFPPATWADLKTLIDEDAKGIATGDTPAEEAEESCPIAS